ncbi:hypothetical protein [Sphaerisporangium album]|uniref:hypothetical protein n=1 Tax=Sphaerisporangium album TaxID=509200 RepID=UPI0011C02312|nr:hypothetical protein [Sphaerisporangium album]
MDLISRPRMAPYLLAANGDREAALRLYAWNLEISCAFAGALQYLEVVLRNAMDSRLASHHGRRDWWNVPRLTLATYARGAIDKAETAGRRRATFTPDDVMTELPFGFWVSLLSRRSDYYTQLWWPALRHEFPGYPHHRPAALHNDLDHLCRLRNRVAHCEPVHHRHLVKDFQNLLNVLACISTEAARCLRRFSRIPEVMARKGRVLDGTSSPRF